MASSSIEMFLADGCPKHVQCCCGEVPDSQLLTAAFRARWLVKLKSGLLEMAIGYRGLENYAPH